MRNQTRNDHFRFDVKLMPAHYLRQNEGEGFKLGMQSGFDVERWISLLLNRYWRNQHLKYSVKLTCKKEHSFVKPWASFQANYN